VSARTVDVLIFIPLIPAIPVIAFWLLPWERWIPKVTSNKVIGPSRDADGVLKLTLGYMYKVHDEEFDSSESFTFTSSDDTERFESRCRVGYKRSRFTTSRISRRFAC